MTLPASGFLVSDQGRIETTSFKQEFFEESYYPGLRLLSQYCVYTYYLGFESL